MTLKNTPDGPFTASLVDWVEALICGPRSRPDIPPHIESVAAKARTRGGLTTTCPEPVLTDLFGFDPNDLPEKGNELNAELGTVCEKIVEEVFRRGLPDSVAESARTKTAMAATYRQGPGLVPPGRSGKALEWKAPDLVLDTMVIETKYRYNSIEGRDRQIKAAHIYRSFGYRPILLHLSPDAPTLSLFESAGWEVYAGQEAYDFIHGQTGTDLRALFRGVGARSGVALRTRRAIAHNRSRRRAALEADIAGDPDMARKYGIPPDPLRHGSGDPLDPPPKTGQPPDRVSGEDGDPPGWTRGPPDDFDRRVAETRAIADRAFDTNKSQNATAKVAAAFDDLPPEDQAELLRDLLARSTRSTQLDALACFG